MSNLAGILDCYYSDKTVWFIELSEADLALPLSEQYKKLVWNVQGESKPLLSELETKESSYEFDVLKKEKLCCIKQNAKDVLVSFSNAENKTNYETLITACNSASTVEDLQSIDATSGWVDDL